MTVAFRREDILAWGDRAAEPPPFLMPGFIPAREVTLFPGPAGANKTTFGLQLAASLAANRPMLGVELHRRPLPEDLAAFLGDDEPFRQAMFITAEDGPDQLQWLLQHQCAAIGTDYETLSSFLTIVSLRGNRQNELATFDYRGVLTPTEAYFRLQETIEDHTPELLVLDNVAHFFAGNENDRREVTAFVNLLYALAKPYETTVVLIAHPNKDGDSWSGSTAWRNAVRSHISLSHPEKSADPTERILRVEKANYGPPGLELRLRWHDFALYRPEDLPADAQGMSKERAEDAAFVRCLEKATEEKRAVSHNPGTNYAPAVFAKMPLGKGINADAFERAMNRLLDAERIAVDQLLPFRRSNRHAIYGLASASTPLRRPPASTRVDPTENCGKSACVHPPLSYGETGGPLEAAPPVTQESSHGR